MEHIGTWQKIYGDYKIIEPKPFPRDAGTNHVVEYVCTECDRLLSNREEWQQHESGEHHEPGGWVCLKCINTSSALHVSKKALQKHTASRHFTSISDNNSDKVSIGKNFQQAFWCGFCRKACLQTKISNEACDARHEHIAQHYVNGYDISQWNRIRPLTTVVRDCCNATQLSHGTKSTLTRTSTIELPRDCTVIIREKDGKQTELFISWPETPGPLGITLIPIYADPSAST